MHTSETPPSRKSILAVGDVNTFGPHHFITRLGSFHTFQARSSEESNTRVNTILKVSVIVLLFNVVESSIFLPMNALLTRPVVIARPTTSNKALPGSGIRKLPGAVPNPNAFAVWISAFVKSVRPLNVKVAVSSTRKR